MRSLGEGAPDIRGVTLRRDHGLRTLPKYPRQRRIPFGLGWASRGHLRRFANERAQLNQNRGGFDAGRIQAW